MIGSTVTQGGPGNCVPDWWMSPHQGISRGQLAYYVDEFTFRFNRHPSASRGLLFYRLLQQATNSDPAPLKDLVIPQDGDQRPSRE